MFNAMARNWWMLVIRGALALIFGALAIFMPGITLAALVILFGAFVLVDGAFTLAAAFNDRGQYSRWWVGLLEGLVGVAIGVLTLFWPQITGLVLLYLIAFWAILTGALEIVAAFELRKEISNEWLLGLSGVLSVVFGALLVLFPQGGAVAIAWLIGLYAVLFGGALIALGLRLRNDPDWLNAAR